MSKFIAFLKNDSGATAIEYGLIAAGISVAIMWSMAWAASLIRRLRTSRTRSTDDMVLAGTNEAAGDGGFFFGANASPLSGWRGSRARCGAPAISSRR